MSHPNEFGGPRPTAPHVAAALHASLPKGPGVAQTKPAGGSPTQALHVRAAVDRGRGNVPRSAPPVPRPAVPVQASPAPGARAVAPHVRQAVQIVQAKAAAPARPPAAHVQACLQRKPAVNPAHRASPPCLQPYNIGEVYDKYEEKGQVQKDYQRPGKDVLHDLQTIHKVLNDRECVNQYLSEVDEYVHRQVSQDKKVTPMAALSHKLRTDLGAKELLKLYETAPSDSGFVKVISKESDEEPVLFQDISAGLFHGEYEHLLQLAIIKQMYDQKESGMKTSFKDVWDAMFDSSHLVHVDNKTQLSLWSIVMDIQGNFIYGKDRKKAGINPLFGGQDQYEGIYGTSATLLHHGFGAWSSGDYSSQGIKQGELAKKFPHLAEAIITRNLKRYDDAEYIEGYKFEGYPSHYRHRVYSKEEKEQRKQLARKIIKESGGIFEKNYDYKVKPSKHQRDSGDDPRKKALALWPRKNKTE